MRLVRPDGTPIADGDELVLVTSDFLATGGDGVFQVLDLDEEDVVVGEELLRDAMVEALARRGGTLRASDVYDLTSPRLVFPRPRPALCR